MSIKNKTTESGIIVPDHYVGERKNFSHQQLFQLLENGPARWINDPVKLVHEGLLRNPIAAACIRLISTAVGQLEFQVFDSRGNLVEENELTELLMRPSVDQSCNSFFKNLQRDKLAFGSAYIRAITSGSGGPSELHLLRPNNVQVEPGPYMLPKWYDYQPQHNGTKERYLVDQVTGECDILRIFDEHPTDIFASVSRLQQAAQDIALHNEGSEWSKKLLQNGARPSGMLTTDESLTDDVRDYMTRELESKFQGAKNAGRPMVLEGGLKWQGLSLSPKDVDFILGRTQAARDIATAFGVPTQLLNIPDSQTYNNNREAKLALYELTVLPEAYEICNELNHWLMPMFGDYTIKINEDEITALQIRRDEMWERLDGQNITTKNERREMLGLEPIEEEELPQQVVPPVSDDAQAEDQVEDDKSSDVIEVKHLAVSNGHSHTFNPAEKNGQSSVSDDHSHSYTYTDGQLVCGITDGHRHTLDE